jgi:hypothetical protein
MHEENDRLRHQRNSTLTVNSNNSEYDDITQQASDDSVINPNQEIEIDRNASMLHFDNQEEDNPYSYSSSSSSSSSASDAYDVDEHSQGARVLANAFADSNRENYSLQDYKKMYQARVKMDAKTRSQHKRKKVVEFAEQDEYEDSDQVFVPPSPPPRKDYGHNKSSDEVLEELE